MNELILTMTELNVLSSKVQLNLPRLKSQGSWEQSLLDEYSNTYSTAVSLIYQAIPVVPTVLTYFKLIMLSVLSLHLEYLSQRLHLCHGKFCN